MEAELRESKDNSLPDYIDLHDYERAWHVYSILEAIDWKWPPNVVEEQDDRLMQDIATISLTKSKIRQQLTKDDWPGAEGGGTE